MIKILIKTDVSQMNGLSYHRLIVPYTEVSDHKEFQVDVRKDISKLSEDVLKQYQIIVFQREINLEGKSIQIINHLKSLGLKIVFDIDDYWILPQSHALYTAYKAYDIPKQTQEILKNVDLVTTTTKLLAYKIRDFNKNVEVIPNCLKESSPQWISNKSKSDKLRFGYVGGVHHVNDVKLLSQSIRKVAFSSFESIFVLGGYAENQHYIEYEKVLSANGTSNYVRINAKPVTEYGTIYNDIDVNLIPLIGNDFSACKSEIKLLEAGIHGNAAIVSNVYPYHWFPRNTAIFIDNSDTNGWAKAMKKLIKEPVYREDKALELNHYVKLNYNLTKWTETRKQILRQLLA